MLQLSGLKRNAVSPLRQKLGETALWSLRQLTRNAAATEVKLPKGKLGAPIRPLLDSLYALPWAVVELSRLSHHVEKTTGVSRGKLSLTIQLQRDGNSQGRKKSKNQQGTLAVVLGTLKTQKLLGSCEISTSGTGTWTVQRDIEFDWNTANAGAGEGEGAIVLRMLHDHARGLDSEMVIALQSEAQG